uniref:Transmembrane protein 100 n=1 Tax=Anabas testudineus TaxID=64144 RepID=A0A3Q1JH68_ANATE
MFLKTKTLPKSKQCLGGTQMEMLNPSALSNVPSAVTYNPKSETVTLPQGITSIAGITVVTGGAELSCGSCMLAFCFWTTLIGFSCIAVGLWDQLNHFTKGTSYLLGLGIVILAASVMIVGSVLMYGCLTKERRALSQKKMEDGKEVLVEGGGVIKKVTV